jgi:hypothetical protein
MLSHFLRTARAVPASGTFAYIGRTTAGITGTDQCILAVPSGVAVGDLLVVTTCCPNANFTQVGPSGWTEHLDTNGRAVYSRIWDGASSNYTFTSSGTGTVYAGVMLAFRNAVFDVISSISTAFTSPSAPSITVTRNDSIQVVCAGAVNDTSITFSQTSGFTEVADLNTLVPAQGTLSVQIRTGVTKGITSTVAVVASGGTANRAWTFSVRSSLPQLELSSSSIGTSLAGTSQAVTTPAGAASGDLLVAVGVGGSAGLNWTSPAGWTEVLDVGSRFTSYRVHDGTTSSYTFDCGSSVIKTVVLLCFKNAAWGAISSLGVASSNANAPTFTVPNAKSLIIGVPSAQEASQTFGTPTGFTQIRAESTSSSLAVFEKNGYQSTAPSQTFTRSSGTGTNNRAWQFSISPTV